MSVGPGSSPRRGLRLADLTALVVGYGLAALLVRAFWPASGVPDGPVAVVLGLEYLWLGLAMSGPVVLLFDRRSAPRAHPVSPGRRIHAPEATGPAPAEPAARYTRAELAWLSIGAYWIGMALFVVPARLNDTPLALLAVFQILAALALWVLGPRRPTPEGLERTWTHRTALVVLATWPLAWVALILLTMTLF